MISGPAKILLWFSLAASPAVAAESRDLATLLAALAREPPQSIPFAEFHTSDLLDQELVVTGTLEYAGVRKLSRVAKAPHDERTDIDGDDVRILRAGRPERRFSLRWAPELGGLLADVSALLGGDRAALEREFEVSLANGSRGWQLVLEPRGGRARIRAGTLRVSGADDTPACIELVANDSRVTTTLLLGAAATDADRARQRELHCGELR